MSKVEEELHNDIVEPLSGLSSYDMYLRCLSLLKVMNKEVIVRTRGKKPTAMLRYNTDADKLVRERLNRSIDHYQKLTYNESDDQFKFRPYQEDIIERGCEILEMEGFLYLTMEVRTGKTLCALGIADRQLIVDVLFLTKKKAISSIEEDFEKLNPNYNLTVINYESMHKIVPPKDGWDLIVIDEAHGLGAYPKPSSRAKEVKELIKKNNPLVIFLSGTPTPESYSQMYHQVYGLRNNPFKEYANFYKFAKDYVDVKQKKIAGNVMNDYSKGLDTIIEKMKPYSISYTQEKAGFKTKIDEEVLYVDMKDSTYKMIKRLKKDKIIEGKNEIILADTGAKEMSKVHQLCSGTVKFEPKLGTDKNGEPKMMAAKAMVIDLSKAEFIKERFKGKKIGIFYKFTTELKALKEVFGDEITTDLDEFNTTSKSIALQIVSGREGISLREAEYLVYYNIDFSATSYWQSRDRMTTMERKFNKVYWVFSKGGIEKEIYKTVSKKKDFTLRHFKKL